MIPRLMKPFIQCPTNWEIVRLKDIGWLQNGISKSKDYFGYGFPFVSYGNVYNDTVAPGSIEALANSTVEEQKLYSVLEGDIFFTRTSETIDEIGISATALQTIPQATFSGFVIRLRPSTGKITKEYSKYFFKAHVNRQFLSREISLVTRASLSQDTLNNLPILLPSLNEQKKIGHFLDVKTQAFNKKIQLLERKIICYQEMQRSLINETVTKGLNKSARLADTEEWLGQVPAHWKIERAKELFKEINKKSLTGEGDLLSVSEYYGVAKRSDVVEDEENLTRADTLEGYKICKKNDLIFNVMLAWKRGLGVTEFDGLVSPSYAVYRVRKSNLHPKYYHYLLRSDPYITEFKRNSTGIIESRLRLYADRFYPIPILVPPLQEQIEISKYLDKQIGIIGKILVNLRSQIDTIKELKKSLINDVVIGKIIVTNS